MKGEKEKRKEGFFFLKADIEFTSSYEILDTDYMLDIVLNVFYVSANVIPTINYTLVVSNNHIISQMS